MYVAPTPFALVEGTAHRRTLIVPADEDVGVGFVQVGAFSRQEIDEVVVAYSFDLRTNILETRKLPNPGAGTQHYFRAYRLAGDPEEQVTLRSTEQVLADLVSAAGINDE
jgi:hypothetical protein